MTSLRDRWSRLLESAKMPSFLRTLFDHNRYLAVALLLIAGLVVASSPGCQTHVVSPISGEKVTRDQLEAEVEKSEILMKAEREELQAETDAAIEALKVKYKRLDYKVAEINAALGPAYAEFQRRQDAINAALGLIGKAIDPTSVYGGLIFSALGIGVTALGMDNKRKDRLIAARVDPAAVVPVTQPTTLVQPMNRES